MLYLAGLFLVVGGFFIFLAALGVYRFSDVYAKCHASSKASTIAKVFVFSALGLYFWTIDTVVQSLLCVMFFFFTVPVGAHLIARAAHRSGAEQSKDTLFDDLKG